MGGWHGGAQQVDDPLGGIPHVEDRGDGAAERGEEDEEREERQEEPVGELCRQPEHVVASSLLAPLLAPASATAARQVVFDEDSDSSPPGTARPDVGVAGQRSYKITFCWVSSPECNKDDANDLRAKIEGLRVRTNPEGEPSGERVSGSNGVLTWNRIATTPTPTVFTFQHPCLWGGAPYTSPPYTLKDIEGYHLRIFLPKDVPCSPAPTVPTVRIEGGQSQEGDGGTRQLIFTARLSAPAAQDVTLRYQTRGTGSATPDVDFVAVPNGALTIKKGALLGKIRIDIKGDTQRELDEKFRVKPMSATGATIIGGEASGTIVDDDAPALPPPPLPKIRILDARPVVEGNAASANTLDFRVTIAPKPAPGKTIQVDVRTGTAGGATPGVDFRAVAPKRLTFTSDGPAEQIVSVTVFGDEDDESGRELVQARLTSARGADIQRAEAFGAILDDDVTTLKLSAAPGQLVNGIIGVREGDGTGSPQRQECKVRDGKIENCAVFIAELSKPARGTVKAKLQVGDATGDTAANGVDFDGGTFNIEFRNGERFAFIGIRIVKDDAAEGQGGNRSETFTATLSNAEGATIANGRTSVKMTILDDDLPPAPPPAHPEAGLFILVNGQAVRISAADVEPDLRRGHLVFNASPGSPLIGQDSAGVYAATSASLVTDNGSGIVSNDGATVIGQDGAGLRLADLLGQDGSGVVQQHIAAIVSAGAGNIVANDGATIVSNDGATIVAAGAGNLTSPRFPGQ